MGETIRGIPIRNDPDAVKLIYDKYIKRPETKVLPSVLPAVPLNVSDDDLIERIKRSPQWPKFARLYFKGDTSEYGNDHSAADMALMVILAFHTQKNQAQMERLFSMSALGQRDKWQKRDYYRKRTITEACNRQQTVYDPDYYGSQAYNDSVIFSFDEPIDLAGGETSSKEMALTDPLLTPEMEEELDPGEWQREDFRNREKVKLLFRYIYETDDKMTLEAFKDRAKALKMTGMEGLWRQYKKIRDREYNKAELAKNIRELAPLPEANSFKLGKYHISTSGIYKEVGNEDIALVQIFPIPLLPMMKLENVETGNVKTKIWFKRINSVAQEDVVENRILADRGKIVTLADRGLPVNSKNAMDVLEYVAEVTEMNDGIIPYVKSVSSLGWHEGGSFSPYDTELVIDNIRENTNLYRSICSKGTLEEWTEFISGYMTDKRLHIVLAASFGSVILRLVTALPFILHLWGKTGTGKTVGLMAAASVWGNPAPGAYLRSMDATTNATMRIAGFLRNLPVISDEMQTVKNREGIYDNFIMKVTEGVERGRLNSDSSLKPSREWNCVLITSGEEPIVSARSIAGAVNRVIEVELDAAEPLFPGSSGNEVANYIRSHYGVAGPEFVKHIKALEPDTIRTMYDGFSKTLMADKLSTKQAQSAAAILTASQIISTLIFCDKVKPLQPGDIIPYLKTELTVDPAERAYAELMNALAANRKRFMSKNDSGTTIYEYEPAQGEVWGKVLDDGYFVNKSILERELQRIGFQFTAVKKAWADKGYLVKDSRGGYYHQRNEQGIRCEYIYMTSSDKS